MKLFEELRKTFGEDIKVIVKSDELPPELKKIGWFSGRDQIEQSELLRIIGNQREAGHNVELTT